MIKMVELLDFLKEIEDITDINGCYFINVEESKVIKSTISYTPSEEILWEICVLRDTFRQFSSGIKHGDLMELMLEGDKGYILLYNIPPKLILLAMASEDINLSYVRLAMLDIISRVRKCVEEFGDQLLKPPEEIPVITVEKPRMRHLEEPAVTHAQKVPVKIKAPTTPITPISAEVETPPTPITLVSAEVEAPATTEAPAPTEVKATIVMQEPKGLEDLIKSLIIETGTKRNQILENIFDEIKIKITKLKGTEISKILELLKDTILESMGTSLALFDISKCAQDLNKVNKPISPDSIKKYQERVENWATRIIK